MLNAVSTPSKLTGWSNKTYLFAVILYLLLASCSTGEICPRVWDGKEFRCQTREEYCRSRGPDFCKSE